MLQTITGTIDELQTGLESALASYRHRVFIEELGWKLPTMNRSERDAFDREDTVYVIAQDERGEICGCGRLLRADRPYLLANVFPHLMDGQPLPRSPDIWELSRFALSQPEGNSAAQAWKNTCTLVSRVVSAALARGATGLIAFSATGNVRLLKRMGVNVRTLAAPHLVDSKSVVAFAIDLDEQTRTALAAY